MSYALLSDDLLLQLEAAGVSRDARLLYLEGVVYCATALTDGTITIRLARLSDADDLDGCSRELVDAGLWTKTPDGYEIANYLDHQQRAEDVERKRADARLRAERSRRHKRGDHSMCIRGGYCPSGALSPSSRARHAHASHDVRSPILTDPDQREGEGKGEGTAADAPDGAHASVLARVSDDFYDLCEQVSVRFSRFVGDENASGGRYRRVYEDNDGNRCSIVYDRGGFYYMRQLSETDWRLWANLREALADYSGTNFIEGQQLTVALLQIGDTHRDRALAVDAIHDTVTAVIDEWDES